MDHLQLCQIKKRMEAATPGPWEKTGYGAKPYRLCTWRVAHSDYNLAIDCTEEDADFIAHAREDIPALVDALTAAELRAEAAEKAAQLWKQAAKKQRYYRLYTNGQRAKLWDEFQAATKERDALRAAAQKLIDYRRRTGSLNFQLEKADDYMREIAIAIDDNSSLDFLNR